MDIVVPELGESVVEATVLRWLKHEGDPISAGEVLVELETEKVNLEVSSERAGVLTRILHKEGDDVKIGDVLGVVEEKAKVDGGRTTEDGGRTGDKGTRRQGESEPGKQGDTETRRQGEKEREATPVAKRYAEEYGVDIAQVPTFAPDGRITKQDVQAYVERTKGDGEPAPSLSKGRTTEDGGKPQVAGDRSQEREKPQEAGASQPSPATRYQPPATSQALAATSSQLSANTERVRMSRRRQTIARRLVEAQHQAAMLTTFNEIDMTEVIALRTRFRDSFKQRYGVGLGFTSFFVKAAIGALKAFPRLNAEIQGDEMILKRFYDIGIAVGAAEGLVVPVLREADRMSFVEIEKKIGEFAKKAEEGTLSLEDLRGGSFTITNGGVFGSLLSTPILNPPQVGILGLHKIEERPIAREGQVVIRPMMYVALSYDHRIVDGREAVQFLVRVKQLIEDPSTLLLEG